MADKNQDPTIAQAITDGIVRGMGELAKVMKPQGPLEMAGLSEERIAQLKEPPKPQRFRKIPWRSPDTEATAIAVVVESKTHKNGRITQLENYRHPPEAYVPQAEGGRVPDGFPMWSTPHPPMNLHEGEEPPQGALNQGFLQWRYENFYRADLERYIGKEIQPHMCADPEGLRALWIEGKVGIQRDAA